MCLFKNQINELMPKTLLTELRGATKSYFAVCYYQLVIRRIANKKYWSALNLQKQFCKNKKWYDDLILLWLHWKFIKDVICCSVALLPWQDSLRLSLGCINSVNTISCHYCCSYAIDSQYLMFAWERLLMQPWWLWRRLLLHLSDPKD